MPIGLDRGETLTLTSVESRLTSMRRILYVWNYREWGGAQIYFLSLMRALRSSQQSAVGSQPEIAVIVPEDSDARVLKYLGDLGVPVEFCAAAPQAIGPDRGAFRKL